MKNKKNKSKKDKKKRTAAPPGNVRPYSYVPRAPKGTHAGESSLASTSCDYSLVPSHTSTSRYENSGTANLETLLIKKIFKERVLTMIT